MTVVPLHPRHLTDADVVALRPRVLRLVRGSGADRWILDMAGPGRYVRLAVVDRQGGVLFAITRRRGAYRITDRGGRCIVETRRLADVLAVLAARAAPFGTRAD